LKLTSLVADMVEEQCRKAGVGLTLDDLLVHLDRMMRGWCVYFRPGVSCKAFNFLSHYAWDRVIWWLRKNILRMNWKELRRRYCGGRWWPTGEATAGSGPEKRAGRKASTALRADFTSPS
jgi:RNA-directed DNA polymerase